MADSKLKKIFNDSVHGHIELHPLLVKIIDTPEFQRLRNIKQLGGGYFVFPGASHNRFEHSIGVAHLAGKLVQSLKSDPNFEISPEEELCVQIAGLCHDMGHGPFSHAFDGFMKEKDEGWKHEKQSGKMFEQLWKNLKREENEELTEEQKDLILKLIDPPSADKIHQDKSYLYEIVANYRTGIDVDKMDYFSRDCHHLGIKCNFSHERYMMFARVCTDDKGGRQICMRYKEAMNMYELFHVRSLLHHNVYQHRVKNAVELMIVDALRFADESLSISDRAKDCKKFTNLTDNILQEILGSDKSPKAKELVERIFKHDFYRFIGSKIFEPEKLVNLKTFKKDKLKDWLKDVEKKETQLTFEAEHFEVLIINLNYGMKNKNPIDALQFYTKDKPNTPEPLPKDEVSYLLPQVFAETKVMMFYKEKDDKEVVKTLMKHIDDFWKLISEDPISAAVQDPKTHVHLTDGVLRSEEVQRATAEKITEKCSHLGLSLASEKKVSCNELKHLDDDKKWKEMLEAWLNKVQSRPAPSVEDFKVVSYVPPGDSDHINIILFCKREKSKDIKEVDIQNFWKEIQKANTNEKK